MTAIPLFLLTAALFDRHTGLWAAAFWSFGVNAITYNRIGKEDSLMVFFMLLAFYFFIRAKQIDAHQQKRVSSLRNLSAVSFGLMLASKYFPHYLGLNMLYHHYYRMRERKTDEPRWVTPFSFFLVIGIAFVFANPAILLPKVWEYLNAYSGEEAIDAHWLFDGRTSLQEHVFTLAVLGHATLLLSAVSGDQSSSGSPANLYRGLHSEPAPLAQSRLWVRFLYAAVVAVPYSLIGAKWPRYMLSLMPFLYMSAAIGAVAVIRYPIRYRCTNRIVSLSVLRARAVPALSSLSSYGDSPLVAVPRS